jgi:hypothetical protein
MMYQVKPFSLAMVVLTMPQTFMFATETRVVITVERPQKDPSNPVKSPFQGERSAVDVAILLDTSNSMDGLISQAKSQLWTMVQQFAKAKKNGQTPLLRVALFEYGNTHLPASEGYIRQVVPLVDDLDKISEALFALSTRGGDEYCGQVIDEAITRLDWSSEPGSYQAIFIAGNEPFTQGTMDYRKACQRAIERGIVINTIHCGNHQAGVRGKWQHGAQLAEGKFFNIDQDRTVVHIPCPQDQIIIRLNSELNKTYLWYGSREKRADYGRNQTTQDANAEGLAAGVAVSRAVTKAGPAYGNRNRDLIDSLAMDEEILTKIPAKNLPKAMQKMSLEERTSHLRQMAKKRTELQKQIHQHAAERETYLAKERQRLEKKSNHKTLGEAVVSAIGKQLKQAGFDTNDTGKAE